MLQLKHSNTKTFHHHRLSANKKLENTENKTASCQCIVTLKLSYLSLIVQQRTRLQIANVSRIMKSSVPSSAKIAKDAKECLQECVSEFISFITSEAAEKCQLEKRKTIGGEDILFAMGTLGFENYSEVLKIRLARLRQVSCHFLNYGRVRRDSGFGG
jgi:histone H3/H4